MGAAPPNAFNVSAHKTAAAAAATAAECSFAFVIVRSRSIDDAHSTQTEAVAAAAAARFLLLCYFVCYATHGGAKYVNPHHRRRVCNAQTHMKVATMYARPLFIFHAIVTHLYIYLFVLN